MTTPKIKNDNPNMDQLIAIGGVRGMTHESAKAFLDQKRTFIEGRGIAAEYTSLAFEYSEIGEDAIAKELTEKAEGLDNGDQNL